KILKILPTSSFYNKKFPFFLCSSSPKINKITNFKYIKKKNKLKQLNIIMASNTLFLVTFLLLLLCSLSATAVRPDLAGAATPIIPPTDLPLSFVGSDGHTFDPMVDREDPESFAVSSSHKAVEGHDMVEQDLCEGLGEEDCLTKKPWKI
ncbi:hypothetical protein LINGRAHAP2_LOCUS9080, partial [Linum grandiflorum]